MKMTFYTSPSSDFVYKIQIERGGVRRFKSLSFLSSYFLRIFTRLFYRDFYFLSFSITCFMFDITRIAPRFFHISIYNTIIFNGHSHHHFSWKLFKLKIEPLIIGNHVISNWKKRTINKQFLSHVWHLENYDWRMTCLESAGA